MTTRKFKHGDKIYSFFINLSGTSSLHELIFNDRDDEAYFENYELDIYWTLKEVNAVFKNKEIILKRFSVLLFLFENKEEAESHYNTIIEYQEHLKNRF